MKRNILTLLVITLTGIAVLSGLGNAIGDNKPAQPVPGRAFQDCDRGRWVGGGEKLNAEQQKKYEAFLAETKKLRASMIAKQKEVSQLMQAEHPDTNKIALLTNEIYDLRDQLLTKATKSGLPPALAGFGRGCRCRAFGNSSASAKGGAKGPAEGQGQVK